MSWLAPQWLWLLLPLGALLLYRRRKGLELFGVRRFWLLLSAFLVVLALCRPAIPREPVEIETAGSDVVVAVDLSRSMQATDLEPSRLGAAKQLLEALVRQNAEDRFGVIGFTTNAIVLSPLTNDAELLLHLFGALDETLVITKGTALMPTLELARKMSAVDHPKLLLLTDGGDALNYSEEARYARTHNLQVSVVMLATRGGSTLSAADGTLLKDDAGHLVVTARNDAVRAISNATGGAFVEGADLSAISGVLREQKEEDYRGKTKVMQYEELFYYFVAAATVAFMLAMTTLGGKAARLAAPLLLLFGVSVQAGVLDPYTLRMAQSAYETGRYAEAAALFDAVDSKQARYNAANGYYRAGEYEKALERYKGVRSSTPKFKAALWFNIANCYIRLQEFARAREALEKSLTLYPDPEAVENLYAISRAESQDHMLTGRQEGKKRAEQGRSESESGESGSKKGGGSNMESASAGAGGGGGKKAQSDPRLQFSQSRGALGSRRYELINQRSVHEEKPW
jgi:Ca-activated chloride channel family protein